MQIIISNFHNMQILPISKSLAKSMWLQIKTFNRFEQLTFKLTYSSSPKTNPRKIKPVKNEQLLVVAWRVCVGVGWTPAGQAEVTRAGHCRGIAREASAGSVRAGRAGWFWLAGDSVWLWHSAHTATTGLSVPEPEPDIDNCC